MAAIQAQSQLNRDELNLQSAGYMGNENAQAQMLLAASQIKPQTAFSDIWGQAGAYNTSKDTAYLNAENSLALQKAVDPVGSKIRQNTENLTASITDPAAVEAAAKKQFASSTLPSMYGTGLDNKSTIFNSALFDKNTLAGLQLRQSLAGLGSPYLNTPQTGLNPGLVASAPGQNAAQAAAQGNAGLQEIFRQAGGLQQNTAYGANALAQAAAQGYGNLYNNIGQDTQADMANYLATQQANQAAGASSSGNKLAAAGAGAATGATLGSVVPVYGTAIGAVAGGLAGYFAG